MTSTTTYDLTEYRASEQEKSRLKSLFSLVPAKGDSALDIGARDGHLSKILAENFSSVTALDLTVPHVEHPRIRCVQGNLCKLEFADNSFDLVLCAEVLEHIPTNLLADACSELARVSAKFLVIGVPYKQDIRVGRTTCASCGTRNPPWGHVNTFDESKLEKLFQKSMTVQEISYSGTNTEFTNPISAKLLDMAGNPYGSYSQEEGCISCGAKLKQPPHRHLAARVGTKVAIKLNQLQAHFTKPQANWIHIQLIKR